MYVRWKLLVTLGLMLWILLCLTDFILQEERYNRLDKSEMLNWPSEEEYFKKVSLEEKVPEISLSDLFTSGYSVLGRLLLWNFSAFASSFGACWLVRKCAGRFFSSWFKKQVKQLQFAPSKPSECQVCSAIPEAPPLLPVEPEEAPVAIPLTPKQSTSSSKIPVLISRSSSQLDVQDAECSVDVPETPEERALKKSLKTDVSTYANRNLEKRCADLREEMLSMRASALKENGTLSRKLEALAREKRELSKRLALSNKENRAAKHQMEELLSERALLMGRLESATKEFKANTRSKKMALEKLEESQGNIERLEQKLEQVTRDKEILERKFRVIEQEFAIMKSREEKCSQRFFLESSVQTDLVQSVDDIAHDKEHVIDKTELVDHIEIDYNDPTFTQAEIDMEKIQEKIMNLEKNLEKFSSRRTTHNSYSETANSSTETHPDASDNIKESESESETFFRDLEPTERNTDKTLGAKLSSDLPLETLKGPKPCFNSSSTEDLYLYPISEECFCSVTEESIPPCIQTRPTSGEEFADPTLSQAEADMRKIQNRILSLEKNLEKFGSRSSCITTSIADSPNEIHEIHSVKPNVNIVSSYFRSRSASVSASSPSDQSSMLYSSSTSCLDTPEATSPELNAYPQHFVTTSPAFQNFLKMLSISQKTKAPPRHIAGTVY